MSEAKPEPPDNHVYNMISFHPDTLKFYLSSALHYQSLLQSGIEEIESDPDLREILGEEIIESLPTGQELRHTHFIIGHIEKSLEDRDSYIFGMSVTHGWLRFVKSVALLYLQHLRERRDEIAQRPRILASVLNAIGHRLSTFEEKVSLGVMRDAIPYPLIINDYTISDAEPIVSEEINEVEKNASRLRPVVLESIEIRDIDLRKRCLDLLAQFREDGQHDRLDTVVNEATRILEDRLRVLSSAPSTCIGMELAKHAFGSPSPRLIVSDISAEQEAAHLLFRGVFGFIRNSVHHRLIDTLQPERVLQIVGMVDYLLFVADDARREEH